MKLFLKQCVLQCYTFDTGIWLETIRQWTDKLQEQRNTIVQPSSLPCYINQHLA